jgi:hypothetical protein
MRQVLITEKSKEICNAAALGLMNTAVAMEQEETSNYQMTEKEEEKFQKIWQRTTPLVRKVYNTDESTARKRFIRKNLKK